MGGLLEACGIPVGSALRTWTDQQVRPTFASFVSNPPAGNYRALKRIVESLDGMTADWGYLDHQLLRRISKFELAGFSAAAAILEPYGDPL